MIFLLLGACQGNDPQQAPPLLPGAPLPLIPSESPIRMNCEGESYQGTELEPWSDRSLNLEAEHVTPLSGFAVPLEMGLQQDLFFVRNPLGQGNPPRITLIQDEFVGFLQIALRDLNQGGWIDCRGSQQALDRQEPWQTLSCQILWTEGTQPPSSQSLRMSKNQGESLDSQTFRLGSEFKVDVQARNDFFFYSVRQATTEQEWLSVVTNRGFRRHQLSVDLSGRSFQLRCVGESN